MRHRELYLKSPHTAVASGSRLRYRPALGVLSYRSQLGLLFDDVPRHTPAERILSHVRGVTLVAELLSVDLLRVGWEGTMWHIRYGEGASFDDSCVLGETVHGPDAIVGSPVEVTDATGTSAIEWDVVAELCARVSTWMAIGPDMLLLAGSARGPILSIEDTDAVVRFPEGEPRLGPGDDIAIESPQLGVVRATISSDGEG
jgi:2-keto-4-pentenoate hydratase/2-oxohepta-3-ene-1,7-dioic acid hydratase in catechol pathway